MDKSKRIILIFGMIAVLLLSSLITGAVFADSGDVPSGTEGWALEIAAGGIFVIMVLKETYALLKPLLSKKQGEGEGKCSECMECLKEIKRKVNDLHTWHDMRDPTNGVFVWYGSLGMTPLREAINSLAESARAQTDILRELTKGVAQNTEEIRDQGHVITRIEAKM